MRCPRCQFENRESVRFCEECGGSLEQVCPSCGAAVPPVRKFCGECGAKLITAPSAAPAPEPTSRFTSPQTYTPQHLAELTSAAELYRAMEMPFWLDRATGALANPDA